MAEHLSELSGTDLKEPQSAACGAITSLCAAGREKRVTIRDTARANGLLAVARRAESRSDDTEVRQKEDERISWSGKMGVPKCLVTGSEAERSVDNFHLKRAKRV